MTATDQIYAAVNAVYTAESRRVLATLIRLLGDFDVAEEAMHDAFRAALEQWPRDGVPANPRAWLVSAGRFKAIDGLRRQKRFDPLDETKAADQLAVTDESAWADAESVEPYAIRAVRNGDRVLFTRQKSQLQPAGNPAARAAIHDLLASVVREGTGRAARINGPVEGKTGTSQNHKDAWFIGFTNDLVVGVWVGNDDNTPTSANFSHY